MSIDISKYVEVVVKKLEKADYYSEIDVEKLTDVIDKYLTDVYDEKISVLATQLELDKKEGVEIDSKKYKREYDKIRREIMTKAYDVALDSKVQLPELPQD